MRTDLGRTGARLPQRGGKGGRGSEVRLSERDRKGERDFRDETFMGLYHAARIFLPDLKVQYSFQSKHATVRFELLCILFCVKHLRVC